MFFLLAKSARHALPLLAMLCLTQGAALAATDDLLSQAYLNCLRGEGDPDLTADEFATTGWGSESSGEEGLIYYTSPQGDDPYVFAANDGSFCHVEGLAIATGPAFALLEQTLQGAGVTEYERGHDDMGCPQFALPGGAIVTITSGGQDPVCTSDTDSAVRYEFDKPE